MRAVVLEGDDDSTAQDISGRFHSNRAFSEPPESAISARASRRASLPRFGSPTALTTRLQSRVRVSQRSSSKGADRFESTYGALEAATKGAQVVQILSTIPFVNGTNTILHHAVTKDGSWVLDCIIDFMQTSDISIDILNGAKRTALEVAIKAMKRAPVEKLLEAGASIFRRNEKQQQPLHFAISEASSAEICRTLLQHGADVDAPLPQTGWTLNPVSMTMDGYLHARDEAEEDDSCAILEVLLGHGAQIYVGDGQGKIPLMNFLKAWMQWDSVKKPLHGISVRRAAPFVHYLRTGRNPLCWFPGQYCPARECNSFASFIFAHTPGSGLAEMLIETTDIFKYGLDLLPVLMSPCTSRCISQRDPSVNRLLQDLLQRLHNQGILSSEIDGVLAPALTQAPADEKVAISKTLVDWRIISESEAKKTWSVLNAMEETVRMRLAEVLLAPLPPEFYHLIISRFLDSDRIFRPDWSTLNEDEAHEGLRDHVIAWFGLSAEDPGNGDLVAQCVIHVMTKSLLSGCTFGYSLSIKQQVFGAALLRERYGLPPVPVDNELLLALRSPSVEEEHTPMSGPSEDTDSYDIPMTEPTVSSSHPIDSVLGDRTEVFNPSNR